MRQLNNYIVEKLKLNKDIKTRTPGEFNWEFVIDMDIVSIMYTGGHYYDENDNSTKKEIKKLFKDIIKKINNIDFEEQGINIQISDKIINISNIDENSLMFAIEQLIYLVEDVNTIYVSDIEYMVPKDQIKKDLNSNHTLWHEFDKYIYNNVES